MTNELDSCIAIVDGEPVTELPADLFIPPDALEVLLESFSGPLDLLLYLIRKQNIDILDIPINLITQQYMQYIELLEKRMELAAEYLLMAAILAEIKSRMLLPPTAEELENEEDPRMNLIRQLQRYEQFKKVSLYLDTLTRFERDVFPVKLPLNLTIEKLAPEVSLDSLYLAMQKVLQEQKNLVHHQVFLEPLSVQDRIAQILQRFQLEKLIRFEHCFAKNEGRVGLIVAFLAILELAKNALINVTQTEVYAPIHIQSRNDNHE